MAQELNQKAGMSGNSITDIYRSSARHLSKRLKDAKTLDEQRLHKLRVDIKNMRVLLDLLQVVSGKKKAAKALQKQLDPVFKKAGDIRTTGLNLSLSQPYRSQVMLKFRHYLRLRQQQQRIDFLNVLKKFDHPAFRENTRKARAAFRSLKRKQVIRSAEEYLRLLFAQVRAEVFDLSDDETLHQIRKRLKSIRNVGYLLMELDPAFPLKEELLKIAVTYEKIGQWHDMQELIMAIEEYVERIDDPAVLEKTAPLIITLKKRCILNKQKIERRLKSDLLMKDRAALKFEA